ncbi:SAC3/GANP/Nin1/mts3/eIF-3 p25 family-domain-containing protein [Lipomyces tetrasporus]|uniref:SAC3/GANP/Nin1/mts3/eIF-3 p25 family-domain-containing protein n=1 Tax=Lipomyces tetrasporus TaxID=54092 RepID=A0AAD7QXD3_9ASCO|nr:SAC3/GANP/Nin1/mts3/eIF-3 p25 family-domain-containing protein [Lipomyces tetrasporus]KAJ8103038.1 SAC3/GANP/Nin1/mts3/eIF-3 p25 family-domain-containing protein [Lipomyces tetrasporus]
MALPPRKAKLPPQGSSNYRGAYSVVEVSKSISAKPNSSSTKARQASSPNNQTTTPSSSKTSKATHSSAPKSPANGNPAVWPDSLKAYVGRCFASVGPSQRGAMEKNLKKVITSAIESNNLWTIDWDTRELPLEGIKAVDDGEDKLEKLKKDTKKRTDEKSHAGTGTGTMRTITSPSSVAYKSPSITFSKSDQQYSTTNEQAISSSSKATKRSAKWDQRSEEPASIEDSAKRKTISIFADTSYLSSSAEQQRKEKRLRRFDSPTGNESTPTPIGTPDYVGTTFVQDTEPEKFVGRSIKLEKKYLRLTSAPDPETVRPLHILRHTLDLLKQKWKSERNYAYICDQFKSMRQDLTVQLIQNEFTVNVYEIHARIALENGDLGEYNQCQTQLRSLYAMNIAGHPNEFLAYRILYLLHTRNRSDMNDLLIELTDEQKADDVIAHALKVREAVTDQDFHSLMRLYLSAPNMGGYIIDSFIDRERHAALEIICKAFRPNVPLRFLTDEIGFESDKACYDFLEKYTLNQFIDESTLRLRTKEAYPTAQNNRATAFKKIDIKGQI